VLVCASCGHENGEGAKFCEECGFSFGASQTRAREQRKTVTVLFCDVTGSTSLGETLDPEALGLYEQKGNVVSAKKAHELLAGLAV